MSTALPVIASNRQNRKGRSTDAEWVTIVDDHNRPIGARPRRQMRKYGLAHRASYILVFNSKDELFVQQRTLTKDIYPGYYDIAAGGVVMAGESYHQSAIRELAEELGIRRAGLPQCFDFHFQDDHNNVFGRVFRCVHDGAMRLQPEEVAGGFFVALPDLHDWIRTEPKFTPDSVQLLDLYGRKS